MPDATITSTESTFGTITGTFAADQSTVAGTVTGIITGTLSGSVGVPGTPGQGVPVGGTAGQFLTKIDGTNYNTDWTTVNLSAYAVKANNLSDLTNFSLARDNLNLGTLNNPTFAGLTLQGSGANVGQYTPTSLSLTHTTFGSFVISPSSGITFPDTSVQTTAFPAGSDLPTGGMTGQVLTKSSNANYDADWATLSLAGYATEAWVTAGFYPLTGNPSGFLTSAPVTSVAGRTGAITLSNSDISGLGSLAVVNDAPSDGSQYARKNAAWDVVISGDRYLTTSTTSNTVSNGNKTFTIGTGLSYTPTQSITISYDASNHMHGEVLTYNSGTGVLTVDINHHTGSGTYASWVVNVGGVVPATSVAWGDVTGTLSSQTDLQNALDLKLAATTAASTYQTISGMSAYLTTSAAATNYVAKSGSAMTGGLTFGSGGYIGSFSMLSGNVITIPDGGAEIYETVLQNKGLLVRDSANVPLARFQADEVLIPSVGITFSDATTQTSAGISSATAASTYQTISGMSAYAPLASPALTGNVTITSNSTGAALFIEQAGTGNILTLHDQASDTTFVAIDQNGKVGTIPSTTASAGFNIPHGTAPTTPVNGDIWTTTGGLFMRQNGVSKQYVDFDTTQTINGVKNFSNATSTFGSSTATGTIGLASGATISGSTKTVNIGTAGVAGSTTNIAIGSTTGTSTTTLQGITNGVTQTAGDSSLKLATTAFVTTADNLKANLASPALTGTPTAPTATAGTNTTQIATTAFVTSAVPAAATHTQALQFSSTSAYTKVIDASSQLIAPSVLKVWPSPSNYNGTATSGAGASAVLYLTGYALTSPSAGVAGNARAFHGNVSGDLAGMLWGGSSNTQINFGRRVSMAFRFSQFPSSTASVTRVLLGKIHGTAVGDLTSRGIGVKYVPNGANFDFQLQVHNGTTLTSVTSSTQYAGGVADLEVVSDGAGNATLYLNGASVATTTGAPTGQTGANATVFAEIESTASTANQPVAAIGRLYVNSLNF
jgi:hypothetical protein